MLHDLYCTRFPSQYFPPFLGTGLSHSLKEYCTPPPQVREHSPHAPQDPQLPCTGVCNDKKENESVNIVKTKPQNLQPCSFFYLSHFLKEKKKALSLLN